MLGSLQFLLLTISDDLIQPDLPGGPHVFTLADDLTRWGEEAVAVAAELRGEDVADTLIGVPVVGSSGGSTCGSGG